MTVYVDDMYQSPMGEFRRMKMSHMIADSHEELVAMARRIGVDPKWIQDEGTPDEHFDIAMSKRALAVEFKAVEVSMEQLVVLVDKKRPKRRLPDDIHEKYALPT